MTQKQYQKILDLSAEYNALCCEENKLKTELGNKLDILLKKQQKILVQLIKLNK